MINFSEINNENVQRLRQSKGIFISRENNKLDIELIDILETRSIKKSYLTIKGKEYIATIDKITDTEVLLKYVDINIKINLVSNEISATNNENIFFLKCDKSKFKI